MKKDDVFFQFIAKSEITQDSAKIDLGRIKIILIHTFRLNFYLVLKLKYKLKLKKKPS